MRFIQKNKNTVISLINVLVSAIQSLWLLGYVQKIMDVEAYGYIAVITSFVNMAHIVTIVFTTFTARYVSLELHKKRINKANEYFNASFFGLLLISGIMVIIFSMLAVSARMWLNVSDQYVSQVQLLLLLIGGSFIVTTFSTPMKAGVYYANKTYIMHGLQVLSYLGRIIFALVLYGYFPAKLWYAYIGSFVIDTISLFVYFSIYKKLMPGIKITWTSFSAGAMKDIISSGLWMSINKIGAVLLANINVIIMSTLISVYITGVYATIVQFVSLIGVLTMTLLSTFVPNIYRFYADDDIEKFREYVSKCVKIISITNGFIVGGMLVFQKYLLSLFISNDYMDHNFIIILTLIYIPLAFSANVLEQVLIAYNKFKIPAISQLIAGAANIVLILLISKLLNIGIYGILISTIVVAVVRDVFFIPLYTNAVTLYQAKDYYRSVLFGIITCVYTVVISRIMVSIKAPSSWEIFIIEVFLVSVLFVAFYFVISSKQETQFLITNLKGG
ncbi:MATE family efflux transporter [Anoxynatronum buryatiense]|uniref:Na+-driven multidrug efflux pump n=1 Tax=Anoxynatronum buryatiense TaxID=489973 RepID=A0AA46AJ12_9CLOT|nr:MATE family efflux transporter [Anoxynatronum buryatiense]SMP56765.1 Na+-driven multidrug efflux pump [Anoxynatronum buryatiense]